MSKVKVKKEAKTTIVIEQIKSHIGRKKDQRQTLVGLGLNKLHRRKELEATPSVLGMVEKVKHLVKIVKK